MFPTTVTYVKGAIEERMSLLLNNTYIIRDLLKGLPSEILEDFIRVYGSAYDGDGKRTKDGRKIPVSLSYPQTPQDINCAIYVGLGESEETNPDIGNMTSIYEARQGDLISEDVLVVHTGGRTVTLTTSKSITRDVYPSIPSLAIGEEHISWEDNVITLTLPPVLIDRLVDKHVTVTYTSTTNNKVAGVIKGFSMTEDVQIVIISNNMDTIICLDLLIRACLILMRSSPEETYNYMIPKISAGAIGPIDEDLIPESPNILYAREIHLNYEVTYGWDEDNIHQINKLYLHEEAKPNGKKK